jgi:uncharacterized repeat protein (TIGR01451 family)
MKKTILLLIFFLSVNINAQINQNVTPYQICNISNSVQFDIFDLTTKIPEVLNGLNPAIYIVSFHETLADAQVGGPSIVSPAAYYNVANPMTIYVRVQNSQTNESEITSFQIMVFEQPLAYPAVLSFCDMMELAIYNLSDADAQITGGSTSATVVYYETLVSAETNSSPIINAYIPTVNPGTQILYARVQNPSTGCLSNITTLSLNTHNCEACQTPSSLTGSNITHNSVNLNWIENGTAVNWDILILPGGSATPLPNATGTSTTSFRPYTLAGLTSATSYDIYVRSVCAGQGLSDWSGFITITTFPAPPVCGGTFTDEGGSAGNYPNNSNRTTTICPTNPGESVTVTFTSFDTEATYDALYVYDGHTAIPSQLLASSNAAGNVPAGLPGGYWGVDIPGPFTSSGPTGCLTFRFLSDATNTRAGWVANISCTPIVCETPTSLAITNLTATSAVLSWVNTANSFSGGEVLILPQGAPAPTANSVGVAVNTNTFMISSLSPDQCYTAYVKSFCSGITEWSEPVSFCMVNCENNGNCAQSLALVAFLDSNNNGVKDSGETNFGYGNFVYQVNDSGNNQYGVSNGGAYYIFDSNPLNSYDIAFVINGEFAPYYTSAVSHNNITLPAASGTNTLYFPVVNILPHVDAGVHITSSGSPRPGFVYNLFIYYHNYGSQTIANGTLAFTKDPNLTITSYSQGGIVETGNGFTYAFTNLGPFESRYISVGLLVPTIPTVNLGDLVTNTATIQINDDINLSNNDASLTQIIVGSYDPNDKIESHGGKIVHSLFTADDYLYYTIQFENTGTASAEFIRVEDILDSQLDESTFEMINASHTVNTKRVGNELTWHFYDINLPPTSLSPAGSHGFVQFRIKPKAGFVIGDVIPNYASIYFDYNPPIVTDSFLTEFVQSMGVPGFNTNTISLYPNPADNMVTIENSGIEKISKLDIYDITSKRIYTLSNNSLNKISIDVSQFDKGIYLIELSSENNSKITKKLILK